MHLPNLEQRPADPAQAPSPRLRSPAQRLGEHWLANLRDHLFGYDFFISYAQRDASGFAQSLKQALGQRPKPLRCFLDSEGFLISDELNAATKRHLRRARRLLLVGSAGAVESPWVRKEILTFVALRPENRERIVALDVMETLRSLDPSHPVGAAIPYAGGPDQGQSRLLLEIDDDELARGPSARTTDRLRQLVGQRRVDAVRTGIIRAIAAVLLAFSVATAWLARERGLALTEAQEHLASALTNLAVAERREGRSNRALALAAEALIADDRVETRRFLVETTPLPLLAEEAFPTIESEAMAVGPNGLLALGHADGGVRLLELTSGQWGPIAEGPAPRSNAGVHRIRFDPDGKRLAVSRDDGSVSLFAVDPPATARHLFEAAGIDPRYDPENDPLIWNRAIFLADGRLAVALEDPHSVQILDANGTRHASVPLSDRGSGVSALAADPLGPRLALGYSGGTLVLVAEDAPDQWTLQEIPEAFSAGETLGGSVSLSALAFDPTPQRALRPGDSRGRLALGGNDGMVRLIADDGELLRQLSFPRPASGTGYDDVPSLGFSHDGERLVALRANGGLAVWRRQGEWALERVVDVHPSSTTTRMHCCIGEDVAATLGSDSTEELNRIRLWDLGSRGRRTSLGIAGRYSYPGSGISVLAFDQTGEHLALGTSSGHVLVYEAVTARPRAISRPPVFENGVQWVGFRPGHAQLASTSYSGILRLFELDACRQQSIADSGDRALDQLYAGAWSVDGSTLFGAYFDYEGASELWSHRLESDAVGRTRLMVLAAPLAQLVTLGERLLAARTDDGALVLIDLEAKTSEPLAEGSDGPLALSADHPDGRMLIAAGDSLRVWRIRGGRPEPAGEVPCPQGETCWADQVVIHPDQLWLAIASGDSVAIRRLRDGRLLAHLSDHQTQIDALALSPDGRTLAAGGLGGRITLWDLGPLVDAPETLRTRMRATTGLEANASGTLSRLRQRGLRLPAALTTRWSESDRLAVKPWESAMLDERPWPSCIKREASD